MATISKGIRVGLMFIFLLSSLHVSVQMLKTWCFFKKVAQRFCGGIVLHVFGYSPKPFGSNCFVVTKSFLRYSCSSNSMFHLRPENVADKHTTVKPSRDREASGFPFSKYIPLYTLRNSTSIYLVSLYKYL